MSTAFEPARGSKREPGQVWSPMHGCYVDGKLERMNCGGTPVWDSPSEMGYRCDTCGAMIGSVGQPRSCVEKNKE